MENMQGVLPMPTTLPHEQLARQQQYVWRPIVSSPLPCYSAVPIPDTYIIDKLRGFGWRYFGNTQLADCCLWIYSPETTSPIDQDKAAAPIAIIPAHSLFLKTMSPRLRDLLSTAAKAMSDPYQPYATISTTPLLIHPPSPEAFHAVLQWMYTADVGAIREFFESHENALASVIANAEWLGLSDRELLHVCEGWQGDLKAGRVQVRVQEASDEDGDFEQDEHDDVDGDYEDEEEEEEEESEVEEADYLNIPHMY
ncbi:uncharacterized protein SPPG_07109 [Spizellomyces punctatus DAOM BR117]|uniref:BTB domain-containing protein n=1 Tax=Spizellomyces punctatus (strain DAOM BR117) TaxID=645134 RepID=A0A0L0H7Z7_SPIPD|nr:hypothetical protein, variant [Spizellomyces punctatus DAOM BR117]XP_016605681.1 uncharacterized protein SPPG_07109 [Spizellomyces punctatus DAOM BR117]KNC97640.1 hypothetical protein, variant [Spizellomyces punctatus DAOM BR117]KNC97641.1 hypothetical protein SPPG_07109 [Spizellomyces punctatus DAOM BR117]|eukprot:XP_016605680.1 hypothetical protein, variant [Spizellomyces punctatus DAOM BR117]